VHLKSSKQLMLIVCHFTLSNAKFYVWNTIFFKRSFFFYSIESKGHLGTVHKWRHPLGGEGVSWKLTEDDRGEGVSQKLTSSSDSTVYGQKRGKFLLLRIQNSRLLALLIHGTLIIRDTCWWQGGGRGLKFAKFWMTSFVNGSLMTTSALTSLPLFI